MSVFDFRHTAEVTLKTEEASLGVSDLCLVLVDTPGFLDDSGAKQDKENMKTIIQYKREKLGSYYPNLIMFLVQVKRFQKNKDPFLHQTIIKGG
jgi:hypothetical protein